MVKQICKTLEISQQEIENNIGGLDREVAEII
jgi:hypothetical protein